MQVDRQKGIRMREGKMRINKYLASCGVCSRRKAEELIQRGEVMVNGLVVKDLSTDIQNADRVAVGGKSVAIKDGGLYYMFNKPQGCLTTASDDRGRPTVLEEFEKWYKKAYKTNAIPRVFPVGRLDYNTQGLLILTTDGELANALMHPSHHIEKTYHVKIRPHLEKTDIEALQNGVLIDGEKTLPALVEVLETNKTKQKVEIKIYQGRNRQVRKMFEKIGKIVEKLERVAVGELKLNGLKRGDIRPLTSAEVEYLKTEVQRLKSSD